MDATAALHEESLFQPAGDSHQASAEREYANYSYVRETIIRFFQNKSAAISLFLIILIVIMSFVGPKMVPYDAYTVDSAHTNYPPRIPGIEQLGICDGTRNGVDLYEQGGIANEYHYFGTDNLGRDLWVRVWEGTQISLAVAFVAVIVDVIIGVIYGLSSGYYGGRVDILMQRVTEVLSSIPQLVIVTLMIVVLSPGLTNIVIALFITGWIEMSRVVRAQVLKLKNQEFTLAARTLGVSSRNIIFKEILPNTTSQIVVTMMFSIPNAIFLEAFLAFVGLGVPAPTASLGTLINDGYKAATIYPHLVLAPVIVLAILMLGFNLFGDGLRDALDPERA